MAAFVRRKGPNGRTVWQVRIRRKGQPSQTRTFDRKADAQAWAATVEADIRAGSFVDQRPAMQTTIGDLLLRYSRHVTPQKRGAAKEENRIKQLLKDPVSELSVLACTVQRVSEFRDRRLQSVCASTVNRDLNLLGHVFTVAAADWSVPLPHGNPVRLCRRPKDNSESKRDRRVSSEELTFLIEAGKYAEGQPGSMPIADIIRFAIETGLRRQEIAAMRWSHANLKTRVLHVPQTKIEEPRTIPLSSTACEILTSQTKRADDLVWGPMNPNSITRAFERARKRGRALYMKRYATESREQVHDFLDNLRFHDLRHEATSRFFERGLNPMQVASISGHKTLQMLKRYTHLRAEDLVDLLG